VVGMTKDNQKLDRSVIVTGASRGLGRAMAIGLLRAGARVALVCTGPSAPLEATLRMAREIAPESHWICSYGDLRDPADCGRVASEAHAAFGAVDALVNNAAVPNNGEGAPFWEIKTEDWLRVAHTNCDTVFFMSRSVAPSMIARGQGKIINISTSDRTMARPRFSPYGPSKAFVETCTRMWSKELDGTGVTMNVLAPGGVVDTAADVTGQASVGKTFLSPSVMAPPLLWLVGEGSDGVTGQRFIANLWDETLEITARVAKARQSGIDAPRIM
jgi:NAD(P)-dependent dehydrogenase (short-subunit alcohol dehydrogenase family)